MVYLRKSEMSDIDLLFNWANDPVARENSFTTDPIPYEVHVEWFNRMMSDDSIQQYIMMSDDIPVGQIRLNMNGEEAEISYSIASDYRGQGYGNQILRLISEKVKGTMITKLVARVKPENIASKKLFEREGYKMKYACYTLDNFCGTTDKVI